MINYKNFYFYFTTGTGTLTLEDIATLSDFQQLLSDEEFVDFFNKFICLPVTYWVTLDNPEKNTYFVMFSGIFTSGTDSSERLPIFTLSSITRILCKL